MVLDDILFIEYIITPGHWGFMLYTRTDVYGYL